MQITITQKDVESALRLYLESKGLSIDGEISVEFIAKRNDEGLTAVIDLDPAPVTKVPAGPIKRSSTTEEEAKGELVEVEPKEQTEPTFRENKLIPRTPIVTDSSSDTPDKESSDTVVPTPAAPKKKLFVKDNS